MLSKRYQQGQKSYGTVWIAQNKDKLSLNNSQTNRKRRNLRKKAPLLCYVGVVRLALISENLARWRLPAQSSCFRSLFGYQTSVTLNWAGSSDSVVCNIPRLDSSGFHFGSLCENHVFFVQLNLYRIGKKELNLEQAIEIVSTETFGKVLKN